MNPNPNSDPDPNPNPNPKTSVSLSADGMSLPPDANLGKQETNTKGKDQRQDKTRPKTIQDQR